MSQVRSRNPYARAAGGLVVLAALGVAAYRVNRAETAPAPPSAPEGLGIDPRLEIVSFPPPAAVPGDIGDVRVSHGPMQVVMTRQTHTSPFRFAEVAKEAGVDFVHVSGMTAEKHFPTANGSGCALFDYDGDGRLDVYLLSATFLPVGSHGAGRNRLYKNLGGLKFRDDTDASGLGFHGFCHGVVVGDIDNDGDQDLFLCNYGPNRLYLNHGDGTFADVSRRAGIDRPGWSSGGAFLDIDDDGDLDLYVANYGEWIYPDDNHACGDPSRRARTYCSPREIRTVKHFLYRNNGDGTFTDVFDQVVTPAPRVDGRGFGVVAADLNGDGKVDLFVANDMSPNFVFLNKGDGTFHDATDSSGAGYDGRGNTQSGMGADAEDVDGDGLPELIISNFEGLANIVYKNLGDGRFLDATESFGLTTDTLPWVGWGIALADFDNDGWPDNFVANGHVDDNIRLLGRANDHEQPALLFANRGGRRFELATRDAGPYFATRHVARGAAFGDLDDDGDIDIVVNHSDGPPALLRNDSTHANRWIRLALRGTRSNRDAVGARIEVVAGGRTIHRQRKGGVSVESANDPRVLVGVGDADEVDAVTVRWPSGVSTTRNHLKTGRTYELCEPRGESPGAQ